MISNNCLFNSLLVIPFFVSKLSLKLGSEKLLDVSALKRETFAISKTELPPLGP
jgi:hypothetical protein